MRLFVALLLLVSCSGVPLLAAAPPSPPHELYGFLLKQDQESFDSVLGMPLESGKTPDGSSFRAFAIPGTKRSHLAVVFDPEDCAITLELMGSDYSGATGFFGLTLGDSAAKVESILGKPSKTRHEDSENLDFWDYIPANYSLEFTPDQKLYSIQVNEDPPQKTERTAGGMEAGEFGAAIASGNVDVMMRMSSGQIVC